DGGLGSVRIHADPRVYAGLLQGAEAAVLDLAPGRKGYVQVLRGAVQVNGLQLQAGDAVQADQESVLQLDHGQDAEVLVFDLAP
ncbi:MAG: quercetin 2,3-dioxygenase, partial [Curvibacter sp.]|nr:quercetin 2,3-dioxygenase [Curvibacter sp.]